MNQVAFICSLKSRFSCISNRNPDAISSIATMVLISPFRNAHRSWHTILILQILVISAIYTFAQETVVRATCLCLVTVLFLALHMMFRPFASEFMNLMQTFLLF